MKNASSKARLTTLPLMMATFFMVSGGPFGLEELFAKAGYRASLVILVLTPILWSLPEALLVAELSSAIPDEGGYYVWVRLAMGRFWGFQAAWLSLASSIFDMAIYPVLFVSYLSRLWPRAEQGANGIWIGVVLIAVCALWNLRGAVSVGHGSEWLGLLLLSPFVVMVVVALRQSAGPAVMAAHPAPDLLGGLTIAMWNYMGWDNASTIAGEVDNPQRTYPRMIAGAMVMVIALYLVCLGAVAHFGIPASGWETGSWADAAGAIAGHGLEVCVALSGMVCGLGMFNALTMTITRVPSAMANDGLAPRFFGRTLANGVPWVSVLVCAAAWMLSLGLSFSRLVLLDILLWGSSLVLEFLALIILRFREPNLPRPFRIPGGAAVCIALAVPPTALVIADFVRNRGESLGRFSSLDLGLVLILCGPLAYCCMRPWRSRSHDSMISPSVSPEIPEA